MFRLAFTLALLVSLESSSPHVTTMDLSDELTSRGRLGGVSVDAEGFVYVADFRTTIWKISAEGQVEILDSSLRGSSGNTVDRSGNLFQGSFLDNRIVRIDPKGRLENYVTEGLDGPVGMVLDRSGNLYVCNCRGNYIAKVDSHREVTRFATSDDFGCPNGITMDANGDLVVVSFDNGFVVRVASDGSARRWVEVPEGRNAHVAATPDALYVTKIESNRIYRIDRAGNVEPFAGTGELGLEDGPALESTLSRPNGIAASPDGGVLYFNNLEGQWRGSDPTKIILRRVDLR